MKLQASTCCQKHMKTGEIAQISSKSTALPRMTGCSRKLVHTAIWVYVLHCFHKTTPKTAKADIDIAARRYKQIGR